MKLKKNELKIFYEGELNEKLDVALTDLLERFGYKRRHRGLNHAGNQYGLKRLVDNVGDLTFDKN